MRISRRLRAAAVVAAAGSLVAAAFVAAPSTADITGNHYATPANASDPFIFECSRPGFGEGYCMVTTKDRNEPGIYPMSEIRGFYSPNGWNWIHEYTALDEADLENSEGVSLAGNKHMWAPAVRRVINPVSGPVPPDEYWLYTPNLHNGDDHLSSRIYVSHSTDPITGYEFVSEITGPPVDLEDDALDYNPNLYMSDPEVFSDAADYESDTSEDYLIWANGDYGTCGTISMAKMTGPTSVEPFSNAEIADQEVQINGLSPLGTCTTDEGVTVNHPYMEGASLFKFDRFDYDWPNGAPGPYTMFVSAKPSVTPPECATPGHTDNNNQVIAYATATNVEGPYTYQGVVSCGSSTEWTNQGTVTAVQTLHGEQRLLLVHHDGDALQNNTRNRQVHSECLFTDENGDFLPAMKSNDGGVDYRGALGWCLQAETIVGLRQASNGHWIQARSDGQLQTSPNPIGLWEHFSRHDTTVGTGRGTRAAVAYNNRNTSQWTSSDNNQWNNMIADRDWVQEWEKFEKIPTGSPGQFLLQDHRGCHVQVKSDGHLQADLCGFIPHGNSQATFEEVVLAP